MKPKGNINENWRVSNENDKISEYAFEEVTEDEFNCVLPSSPNWYCNNILHSYNGYFAFGGKNACFIFDMKKKPPICTWSMVGATFSIRVTAVSLLSTFEDPSKEPDMLAFAAEDGHLKVVNIANKTTVTEHKKHMAKITSISWTHVNKTTIISGDEKGVILVWDFVNKICNVWTPLQTMLTYISSSPHSADIAAFGYMNGNIILGDTKKLNILHTFKNHINEVCHISWHPFEGDQFVSIAKDKTLRIYSTTDKILRKSFTTPRNIGSRNNSNKNTQQTSKPYFTVLWLDNDRIVSSFPTGELLSWDINSGKWKAITNGHNRIIFCLRKDDLTNQLISVSMDRMILIHKTSNLKVVQRIPTFGGFVYSLSSVPQDPHRFAVGVGDNTIRVWSTGDQADPYNSASIWHSIKTKVTVIQYHPTKEGIIAFGTEDGHVGCYSSITQKSDVSTSYHKKTVYALEWGPCSCSKEEQEDEKVKVNCLYSVGGEGMILMHKLGAFNQKAVDIGALIKKHNHITSPPSRSEIKWHQSYQFVAIGNEDGTIDVFDAPYLTLLGHIQAHKKIINSIDWHHDFTADLSDCSFWIASGSNEETVCVYDARSICLQEKSSIKAITVDTPYQILTGHSSRITKVKWSPHAIGVLASSSYDGSIQVWDVKKNEGLGNYRGHLGRVHCVAWSYVSSDVLLSGGEDFCLHRWRYTETKDKMPPSSKSKQSKTRKKKKKDAPEKDGESKKELIQTDEKPPEESSKPATLEEASNQQPSQKASQERTTVKDYSNVNGVLSDDGVEFVEQLDGKHRGKKPKVSLLKLSSIADSKKKELMQEDCINLATYLKAESTKLGSGCEKAGITPGSEEHVNLGLYTDRKGVFTMLSTESQNHKESGSIDKYNHLQIWQNSIPAAIEHAVKNKCLNDSLVALSPLGGYDLWLSTCMKYAEQLEERSNFSMAANYYMMSGDFNRVINMFKANNFIKEALTFAKSHLPKGDPTLTELYLLWAKKLSNENSYENAAECYLACGHTDDAITMLSKRNDANAIMTALKVAAIYEMTEKCDQLSTKAAKALLQEQRWSTCFELMKERPALPMINKIQLVVGEILLDYVDRKQLLTLFLEDTDNHQTHRCFSRKSKLVDLIVACTTPPTGVFYILNFALSFQ
uniref:Gem-associated protein 5 n=1 Tax=Clytia hemisphaerica TaxID=252671 RepID=A0A7M5VCG5_9CNID